jgi:hypothetical protein
MLIPTAESRRLRDSEKFRQLFPAAKKPLFFKGKCAFRLHARLNSSGAKDWIGLFLVAVLNFANRKFSIVVEVRSMSELIHVVEAVRQVTGKQFHTETILRWRRQGRLTGCKRIGRSWYCSPDAVRKMVNEDSAKKTKPSK